MSLKSTEVLDLSQAGYGPVVVTDISRDCEEGTVSFKPPNNFFGGDRLSIHVDLDKIGSPDDVRAAIHAKLLAIVGSWQPARPTDGQKPRSV